MSILGTIHTSNNYGKFKIIEYIDSGSVVIEFLATGFVTKARAGDIRKGEVKDRLKHHKGWEKFHPTKNKQDLEK